MEYLARFIARRKYQRRQNEITPRDVGTAAHIVCEALADVQSPNETLFVLHTSSSILLERAVGWDDFLNRGSAIGTVLLF